MVWAVTKEYTIQQTVLDEETANDWSISVGVLELGSYVGYTLEEEKVVVVELGSVAVAAVAAVVLLEVAVNFVEVGLAVDAPI
eukprot:gene9847-biopygen1616